MHNRCTITFLAATLVGVASGCAQMEPEPVAAAEPAVHVAPPVEKQLATEAAKKDARQAVVEAMAGYVAPYPERHDLFVRPKAGPLTAASSSNEGAVQLRGLVDLGEPRAILDIEGATALVAVGSEKYGVRVLSIDDQKVTLQRGSTRWTTSLD